MHFQNYLQTDLRPRVLEGCHRQNLQACCSIRLASLTLRSRFRGLDLYPTFAAKRELIDQLVLVAVDRNSFESFLTGISLARQQMD